MDVKEKRKKYYLENRERILQKNKEYYHNNKEARQEYNNKYWEEHKKKYLERRSKNSEYKTKHRLYYHNYYKIKDEIPEDTKLKMKNIEVVRVGRLTTLKLIFRRWLQKFQHHKPTYIDKDATKGRP